MGGPIGRLSRRGGCLGVVGRSGVGGDSGGSYSPVEGQEARGLAGMGAENSEGGDSVAAIAASVVEEYVYILDVQPMAYAAIDCRHMVGIDPDRMGWEVGA